MCGIAGFSLHPSERINARTLAHELLVGIEQRGSHASGFAFTHGTKAGIHKDAVPGSQLPLTGLPRNAEHVILHTRYATQGAANRNWNNHPVLSPSGNIALVHNGVISNDWELRDGLLDGMKLPEVDTAVVPALMDKLEPSDAFELLEGYAAFAWIDHRSAYDAINIARVDFSPVFYTWTHKGSFVFASSITYIAKALDKMGIGYGYIFELAEHEGYEVSGGVIQDATFDYKMQEDAWVRRAYGAATAGGHSNRGSENVTSIGSSFAGFQGLSHGVHDDESDFESMSWEDDYRARSGSPMVLSETETETNGRYVKTDDGMWEYQSVPGEDISDVPSDFMGYYVTMEDGSIEHFPGIEDMEGHLAWLAGLGLYDGAPFEDVEHTLKWINHIMDIGTVTISGGLESWLEDMGRIDQYDSKNPAMYTLGYVRDGVSRLLEKRN